MATFAERLTGQPSVLYRKNARFYLGYDIPYLLAFVAAGAAVLVSGWSGFGWDTWMWALLPAAIYVHVLANVCVHNACHGNFPKAINRIVGEILGVLVVTRFASWEILHQRHHRYSDDPEKDPHPCEPNFWKFLARVMLVNVERQLQNIMYDQHGDTPQHRRYERWRAIMSFATMAVLLAIFHQLLGWQLFLYVFVPTQIVGWIVVGHFNWATHNGFDPQRRYGPINIDRGLYWIGNRVWFGLYMHKNHHDRANIFNPLKMEQVLAKRAARRADQASPPPS